MNRPISMKMQRYSTYPFLVIFGVVYFAHHILLLYMPPHPWFDETFFASMTAGYNATGKFNLDIAPFAYSGEILIYGPVYFWITSLSTKILGFAIFSFRLPSVICGFFCVLIFYKILRLHLRKEISLLVILAYAFDPLSISIMQSGRMEPVALFFALLSLLLYFKAIVKPVNTANLLLLSLSGAIFSFSLLTTPRTGVLLVALGIIQLWYILENFNRVKILQISVFGASLITVYLVWVFYAFGSISNLVKYFARFNEYVGGKVFLPKDEVHIVTISLISLITGISLNYKKYLSGLIVFSVLSITVFHIVVNDTGLYSTIIAPFHYLIIGSTVSLLLYDSKIQYTKFPPVMRIAPIVFVLFINLIFFALKSSTIYFASEKRNTAPITEFIKTYIPPKSKVIGDELFYYFVHNTNSDFQYINHFKSDFERKYYQSIVYDYDYIILSEKLQRTTPNLFKIYQKNTRLVKVADFRHNKNNDFDIGQQGLSEKVFYWLQMPMTISYNCTIFKRVK